MLDYDSIKEMAKKVGRPVKDFLALARISHTAEYIEAANQRKPLCCNHFRRLAERAHADRVSPGFVWICTR